MILQGKKSEDHHGSVMLTAVGKPNITHAGTEARDCHVGLLVEEASMTLSSAPPQYFHALALRNPQLFTMPVKKPLPQ